MDNALHVVEEVSAEYRRIWNRGAEPIETYLAEDAEVFVATMGALSGPAKIAVRELRDEGLRIGLLRFVVPKSITPPLQFSRRSQRLRAVAIAALARPSSPSSAVGLLRRMEIRLLQLN